jgi:serine/threonine-protein kinase
MPPSKSDNSGSRQVLIVLAVVLALLVLLCAGVISFLVKEGNLNAMGVPLAETAPTAQGAAVVNQPEASYRLGRPVLHDAGPARSVYGSGQSDFPMTEGRQTL